MSRKQGPRKAGMRPSARAEGTLQSSGAPTGLLLARAVGGRRHSSSSYDFLFVKEAAEA